MRVKSVPRQLPRKAEPAAAPGDHSKRQRREPNCSWPAVKTVLFSSLQDIVQQVNLEFAKQTSPASAADDVGSDAGALDLSRSAAAQEAVEHSYLYELLTDPQSLQRAERESRLRRGPQQQQQQGFECPYCKKEFDGEAELKAHSTAAAASADGMRQDKQALSCCACGKSFAQKRYLRYHQRSHSERSKYSCDICTRKYSRLDNLTRHNVFHTDPHKFACSSCPRTFARKDLLNKHLRSHENKYKYHCHVCQKYFKGPLSLQNHRKLFH